MGTVSIGWPSAPRIDPDGQEKQGGRDHQERRKHKTPLHRSPEGVAVSGAQRLVEKGVEAEEDADAEG